MPPLASDERLVVTVHWRGMFSSRQRQDRSLGIEHCILVDEEPLASSGTGDEFHFKTHDICHGANFGCDRTSSVSFPLVTAR